ncbi:hypothetical protein, partial [Fructilactobacillus florum]|uniref:hypothetical protein n=1 Tax=Fructilactobacillus florum TaxID=640331 RepID=UPI000A80459E
KHYDKVQKAEHQRVEFVKKTQKAIVKDFASQYAGVKTIKFDKYLINPMGHVAFIISVNGYTDNEHSISYTVNDDGSVEMLSYSTIPVKKGKTKVADIKVTYNTDEEKHPHG